MPWNAFLRLDIPSSDEELDAAVEKTMKADWNDPASIPGLPPGAPIPKALSAEEVRSEARKYSESIFKSYGTLNRILQSHEAVIQKRWVQKSKKKRSDILLQAWPNMPTMHRPDFDAVAREPQQQRMMATRFADAFRFPHINLEDLTKMRPLLLMLNARGRNKPDVFAMSDNKSIELAYRSSAITPIFLNLHTMLLRGQKTPQSYGALVNWTDEPDACRWVCQGKGLLPGSGLEVLYSQDRLMKFLLRCCASILHDLDVYATHYPPQSEPMVPSSPERLSTAELSNESAYGVPSAVDFGWLESLVAAEFESVQDHFVALREDPAYFQETMLQYKEHRTELLLDIDGNAHPTLRHHSGEPALFWQRILRTVVTVSHFRLESWKAVHEKVAALCHFHQVYVDRISADAPLPRELLDKFLECIHHLKKLGNVIIAQLKDSLTGSPNMRRYFVRERPIPSQPTLMQAGYKKGVQPSEALNRVMFLVGILADEKKSIFWGVELLVDELEHFIQHDQTAQDLISPHIARLISGLGVVVECSRQIHRFQPWASGFQDALIDREEHVLRDYADRTYGFSKLGEFAVTPSLAQAAMPSNRKFDYPVGKRRTRDNVEAMQRAEKHLDSLWAILDADIVPVVDAHASLVGLRQYLGKRGKLDLQRTAAWTEEAASDIVACSPVPLGSSQALIEYYQELELRSRPTRTEDELCSGNSVRVKEKTRAQAQPGSPVAASVADTTPAAHSDTPLTVSHRSLKVFKTIFFVPNASSHPGEVPWRDFVGALKTAGLDAQKLQGSAWQFFPSGAQSLKSSIIFHEPHPAPNLPFYIARRYGRRLRKVFGWHIGMFSDAPEVS